MKDKKYGHKGNERFKNKEKPQAQTEEQEEKGVVVGRNAVRELLKSDREVDKLYVRKGDKEGSITVIIAEASKKNIPIVEVRHYGRK